MTIRPWGNHYRILVLIVGFLCLANMCSNHLIINFTFICMKDDFSSGVFVDGNGTAKSVYDYTPDEKKYIMWSVAFGTTIGAIPLNMLYVKYGARFPFLIAGFVSCISTAFIPWAAQLNFLMLIALRFIQGLAYSADFAAIGLITVRWAPLSETATFVAILTSFNIVASTITNSVTGLICESSFGWRYSYYAHGFVGLALFILWSLVYVDHPEDTRRVSSIELKKIQKNKSEAHLSSRSTKVPYWKILTSPVIICVWLNAFFDITAAIMFSTYVPLYLNEVLKFGIAETGFYSAVILGLNVPVRFVFALISDKCNCISEYWKIMMFNSIALGVSGIFFGSIGFIPVEHRMLAVLCFFMTMCCIAVNSGAFYKSGVLHSLQYAHVVLTAIQWVKCLALFAAPALVACFVAQESEREQWIWVYVILGGLMIITNFISFFFLTDKPAEWTKI